MSTEKIAETAKLLSSSAVQQYPARCWDYAKVRMVDIQALKDSHELLRGQKLYCVVVIDQESEQLRTGLFRSAEEANRAYEAARARVGSDYCFYRVLSVDDSAAGFVEQIRAADDINCDDAHVEDYCTECGNLTEDCHC